MARESAMGEAATRRAAQQELALEALARGATYRQAGDLAGVTAKTIQRWMHDATFARQLAELRADRMSQVTGMLLDATTEAVEVVRRECTTAEKSGDRIRAAALLLTMATKLQDRLDLEARLSEIEAFVGLGAEVELEVEEAGR